MNKNVKRKLQIALRRFYINNSPNENLSKIIGIHKVGFINHIEQNFIGEMNYTNFGKLWTFDHIVPVELFDLTNSDEIELCYNFNNIFPMYIKDNRCKGASVHFSLEKLKSVHDTNVYIERLIDKCNATIEETYKQYI